MYLTIYTVILSYFLLGAIGFFLINRKKETEIARKSWTKYGMYFLIINGLFLSIVCNSTVFRMVSVAIFVAAAFELLNLFVQSGYKNTSLFTKSKIILILCAIGFYGFVKMDRSVILFSFLILSIFDSFSQITGQLFGRKKLFPNISPNKTIGGLLGGSFFAVLSALLLHKLYPQPFYILIGVALGIVAFAFGGDLAASYYKRQFGVKDFSNLIPGHGGILDRFDSLISAGAWMGFIHLLHL